MKTKVPSRRQILQEIGMLIVMMQTTERLILTNLNYALPSSATPQSLEDLTREIRSNAGSTLGRLISKLRQRVGLADDFEDVLRAFLQDRNTLVHDLERVPGFGLSTPEGRAIAGAFVANLYENNLVVTKVFVSLLSEWASQVGLETDLDDRVRKMLGDLDGIAGQVFYAKK